VKLSIRSKAGSAVSTVPRVCAVGAGSTSPRAALNDLPANYREFLPLVAFIDTANKNHRGGRDEFPPDADLSLMLAPGAVAAVVQSAVRPLSRSMS
jgi:hypothetical protein